MKIAILTSKNQWFVSYAKKLCNQIDNAKLFYNHKEINGNYDIVFILSYHAIIENKCLKLHKHNIVIHESCLPHGKGWSPLFWQILEGKGNIPFTMFEASNNIDNGDIYMQKTLKLTSYELNQELREKQANFTMEMCLEFLNNYAKYSNPSKKNGQESFYRKKSEIDDKIDVNKTIKEQFNLLRIVNNKDYPAFFELDGNKYILKIELGEEFGGVILIDFVDLNLKEKKMVLDWRNNENIKKWMYSQNDIKIENHLDFINNLIYAQQKQYILIKKDGQYIGVIYFSDIDYKSKECEFGLYTNPLETTGFGRILMQTCIKYVFYILRLNTIKLEVFSNNTKAKKLYDKFNFKEISTNNTKIVCMKLIKTPSIQNNINVN
ncbi:hypothetical protein SPONN_400 [uncultured Candidatus Thioglobus sp.]|nr:hypothetical protein SPONN_400 [uncultured Candidatus Thioglobus sp.]